MKVFEKNNEEEKRTFWESNQHLAIFFFMCTIFSILAFAVLFCKKQECEKVKGYSKSAVVIDHSLSTSRNGYTYYHTIIKTTKGTIMSIEGVEYYIVPVGDTIK